MIDQLADNWLIIAALGMRGTGQETWITAP